MEKFHSFKLVDGQFNATEAANILFSLINSKMNYHNIQAFSIEGRFNGDVAHLNKRVEALKSASEDLKEVLDYASENRLELKIDGVINIELVEKA
jgi:hypothetical protein